MHAFGVKVAEPQYKLPSAYWNVDASWLLKLVSSICVHWPTQGVTGKHEVIDEVVFEWAIGFVLYRRGFDLLYVLFTVIHC